MNRQPTAADWGLVSLIIGGTATTLLGILLIASAAFLGWVPLFLLVLFGLASLVTLMGAAVTVISHRAITRNQD